jgi:DNA adenine methylase
MKAPFPYPGGKGKGDVLALCWAAMGADVPTYIEPFAGSLAMLLGRPNGAGKYEMIGDANGLLVNVWRSIRYRPDKTALHCDHPPTELGLRARSRLLVERAGEIADGLASHPEWCDPKAAGWWIWCQSVSFAHDWLSQPRPPMAKPYRRGLLSPESDPLERCRALAERLRRVGMAHGDWSRLVTNSALGLHNTGTTPVAVFLDPPYPDEAIDYGAAPEVARDVELWCREHGDDPRLRLVLCGHVGDYELPGWRAVNWGGSRGWGRARRGDNECVWLSPHCRRLESPQPSLFSEAP